ncbi:YrhB domain-containing protein [uncultured Curtobacterium sp.]|uniref:YrhB domain-containing protein n=1 Tax=uncultured Curtobacterium sp. TaxID=331964 RepID=UPI00258E5850|nr:YrhB domain-containing protein [uncultured Curtobacterium sp.]
MTGHPFGGTSRSSVLPAVPVPDELHLAVDDRGQPVRLPFDRGRSAVFAYAIAADRPADRGVATRVVRRKDLAADERSGRYAVQVDAASGSAEGLSVTERPGRQRQLLPYASSAIHASALTASRGIWAEAVVRVSAQDAAFELFAAAPSTHSLTLVIDPDPESWVTRAAVELGPRPHPEVLVVTSLDAVPPRWRRAARVTLAGRTAVTARPDLTLADARERFVAEHADVRDLVWDRAHVETEDWWIVLFDSRAWYETGDVLLRLVGNGPFVVPKDGSPSFRLHTATSIEAQLAEAGQRIVDSFLS